MAIQEEIIINASPAAIFAIYADVEGWNKWDANVRSASIAGEFRTGTKGLLIPAKGPKAAFTLSEVAAERSFTSETRLPLCTMRFAHELEAVGDATRVVHRVSFTGPLSFLWKRIIGSQIRDGLPAALLGLKNICESNTNE